MAICYAGSTLAVLVSAVSAYMQHVGMASPFESKEFCAMMEGIRRWKGLGKQKKPPVKHWHASAVMEAAAPLCFRGGKSSRLQLQQAKVLMLLGWQLFCRPHECYKSEVCGFRFLEKEMEITIRYEERCEWADTRSQAGSGRRCLVPGRNDAGVFCGNGFESIHSKCGKVLGEPARCSYCPAAFPPVWKHGGVQNGRSIPTSQVSQRIKALFLGLAEELRENDSGCGQEL